MLASKESLFDKEKPTKRQPEKDGARFLGSTPARQCVGKAVTECFGMGVIFGVLTPRLCPY
jgi:hypothetical protein